MSGNRCKTPMIFQMEATECGAASFSMVCAYWGKYVPLEQMRIETGVSRDGCSGGDIMRAAKRLGLKCRAQRKSADSLWESTLPGPMILLWGDNHFVVLEGFDRGLAWINDPEVGRRTLGFEEFAAGYSGVAMGFEPTPDFQPSPKVDHTIPLLAQRASRMTGTIAQLVAIGVLVVVPGIALALLLGAFVDGLLGASPLFDEGRLPLFLMALVGVVVVRLALSLYRAQAVASARFRFEKTSANEFLQHLFRLPLGFFEMRFPGDVVARVGRSDAIGSFVAGDFAEALIDALSALLCLVALGVLCPLLALVGCSIVALAIGVSRFATRTATEAAQKDRQDNDLLLGVLCAGMDAVESLQVAGAHDEYADYALELGTRADARSGKARRWHAVVDSMPTACDLLGSAVMLAVGALVVASGGVGAGTLFACVVLYGMFSQASMSLASFARRFERARIDADRVDDVLRMPEDAGPLAARTRRESPAKLTGTLRAAGVTYGYTAFSSPVVHEASFSLEPGQMVALVGPSGCGKSTFVKLLAGLYRPRAGSIRYDDRDIADIPADTFHASVAFVGQECAVFAGSVRDNLTLWNPAVLEADLLQAARDACIHEDIERMSDGYDHRLAPGGANLSGGQRQRLEIARALATNPSILVLDEATSALDDPTERQVLENIRRRGCACIIVAHREGAMRACDRIVVMDDGTTVVDGAYEVLAQSGAPHANLLGRW